MKNPTIPTITALALLAVSVSSQAAAVWDGGAGTVDWLTASNWNPNSLPVGNDNTTLDGGGTGATTLTGGNVTVAGLQVKKGHVLTIDNDGYTLTSNGAINMSQGAAGDGTIINHLAGTVSLGSLLSMSGNATGGTSFYNLSGGTLTTSGISVGNAYAATFSLIGELASVTAGSGAVTAGPYSTFNFELGSMGIDAIDTTGSFSLSSGAALNIIGSSYTGGAGTISLFSYGSRVDDTEFVENISGFTGLNADVVYSDSGIDLVLTVVPEPSAAALLGLGAVGLLVRRRRA